MPAVQDQKKYLRDQILNASPEQLVILMIDGAIEALEESKNHIDDKNPFEYSELNLKAQRIVLELTGALKQDVNPEVVTNLYRLYEFAYHRLVSVNTEKNAAKIDEVIFLLKHMKETWNMAIDKAKIDSPTKTEEVKKPSLSLEA